RNPSPKMQEVKLNYQNITAQVGEQEVREINKNLFVNTDAFKCIVTVARNGKVIRRVGHEICVEPLSEKNYTLPVSKETKPGEYTITVSFHLKEDTMWANAGHEVAFGQYVYKVQEEEKTCQKKIRVIRSV